LFIHANWQIHSLSFHNKQLLHAPPGGEEMVENKNMKNIEKVSIQYSPDTALRNILI
jgi:hypothetical protein